MGLFAISGLIFLLVCVGVGIVLSTLILLLLFGLISAGILSASVMIGLNKKSFSTGFRTFIFSFGCIFGTLSGIVFFLFLHKVSHWWTMNETLLMGSFAGLLSGFLFSVFVFFIFRKLSSFLVKGKKN